MEQTNRAEDDILIVETTPNYFVVTLFFDLLVY